MTADGDDGVMGRACDGGSRRPAAETAWPDDGTSTTPSLALATRSHSRRPLRSVNRCRSGGVPGLETPGCP